MSYEIKALEKLITEKFDHVETKFNFVSERFDTIDKRFDKIDAHLASRDVAAKEQNGKIQKNADSITTIMGKGEGRHSLFTYIYLGIASLSALVAVIAFIRTLP